MLVIWCQYFQSRIFSAPGLARSTADVAYDGGLGICVWGDQVAVWSGEWGRL